MMYTYLEVKKFGSFWAYDFVDDVLNVKGLKALSGYHSNAIDNLAMFTLKGIEDDNKYIDYHNRCVESALRSNESTR